jgi:radical SAM superfamily enzyme YgiQ (UPF0313 family)
VGLRQLERLFDRCARGLDIPARDGLAPPARYAHLLDADGGRKVAGDTETTRGCLDTCRHCPVPAVYRGRFFAIDAELVLGDVAAQIAAGGRDSARFDEAMMIQASARGAARQA